MSRRTLIGGVATTTLASQVPLPARAAPTGIAARYKSLADRIDVDGALAFLSSTVRQKSFSDTEGENALAKWMVDAMRTNIPGIQATAQAYAGKPGGKLKTRYNAIGRLPGTGGGKSILFNGHIDTNPVTEGWTVDPFAGLVRNDAVYGIGVSNMKAGNAAYFWALRELVKAGVRLKGDVILTFVTAELGGGLGTQAVVDGNYRADYFINSEPTDLVALTMHAISGPIDIELIGVTRHLSKRGEAVDALAAACDLVPRLNAMTFTGAQSAEHASINRGHVGVIHGALGRQLDEWRPPQVADYAVVKGSARYAPGQTHDGVMDDIDLQLAALKAQYPGLMANNLGRAKPPVGPKAKGFFVDPKSPIVRAVNEAYLAVRGVEQPTGPGHTQARYYGTDAPILQNDGKMEGLVCGPGGKFNTMPDERVEIADYLDMIRIYMLTIADICGVA
jgi:acetylornithine deacetylase